MSGYAYDYSLSPARPSGWRSALTTGVAIIAVVAVSTISGAVVTLELIASPPPRVASALVAAAVPPASKNATTNATTNKNAATTASAAANVRAGASTREPTPPRAASPREAASVAAPAQSQAQPQTITQSVAQSQSEAQSKVPLTVASVTPAAARPAAAVPPPTVVATPQTVPAIPPAAFADAKAPVSDRDLTFAKGYAQRKAAQNAAQGAPATKVATLNQFGRSATVQPKPKMIARTDPRLDPRHTREEGSWSGRYDFERHQALAFGDSRQNRRPPPVASPFGIFDRLF